jgi:hypothetical protein
MTKELYETIVFEYLRQSGVTEGRMMSSPALKWNDKVFAFYHDEKMCFKLGDSIALEERGLPVILLSPFKTKGPLKGWYWVSSEQSSCWSDLTGAALRHLSGT